MVIDSVIYAGNTLYFEREENAFFIQFPSVIKKGEQVFLTIHYHGKPIIARNPPWDGGFIWEKDDSFLKAHHLLEFGRLPAAYLYSATSFQLYH
jgi:hypothetical protein